VYLPETRLVCLRSGSDFIHGHIQNAVPAWRAAWQRRISDAATPSPHDFRNTPAIGIMHHRVLFAHHKSRPIFYRQAKSRLNPWSFANSCYDEIIIRDGVNAVTGGKIHGRDPSPTVNSPRVILGRVKRLSFTLRITEIYLEQRLRSGAN